MPIYNDEAFVAEAIESLLAQSFHDFRLLISDNASTDNTERICREYARRDRRIAYYRQPLNLGAQGNFKFLLNEARSEFFMWVGSDDRWNKEYVSSLVNALKCNPDCVSAFCPYGYINEKGMPIRPITDVDYSSRSLWIRILKFLAYYDDTFIYGLHRRIAIQDAKFPVWWGINSRTPLNWAFPVLTFFLARGNYVQVGKAPLAFYRIHESLRHPGGLKGKPFANYLASILRSLNVFCESVMSIHCGTKSLSKTLLLMPALFVRLAFDVGKKSSSLVRKALLNASRKR
jgi:glycosyltransferase involved in cell wall biosynthesis